MGLIITIAVLIGGYAITSEKGANWYWALLAGFIPAAFCFFLGLLGLPFAILLLVSYNKIELG